MFSYHVSALISHILFIKKIRRYFIPYRRFINPLLRILALLVLDIKSTSIGYNHEICYVLTHPFIFDLKY